MNAPRPRAPLADVLRGRVQLVGARYHDGLPPGWLSPAEARHRLGLTYDDPAAVEAAHARARSRRGDLAVCLRAAIAFALPGGAPRRLRGRVRIVAADIDNLSSEEAVEAICAEPLPDRARLVHFVHAHAVALAARDRRLRRHLAAADLVLGDGIGLRVAAALLGDGLRANVNGTDLFSPLLTALRGRGRRLAMIGAAPGVAARCAEQVRASHPGLEIALVSSGFLSEVESEQMARRLAEVAPCTVLVGMGTPLQERWVHQHLARVPGLTVLTVGGLFDFHGGAVRRAPPAWREVGMEWLYRALHEPRRLARRNLVDHPRFLAGVVRQRVRRAFPAR